MMDLGCAISDDFAFSFDLNEPLEPISFDLPPFGNHQTECPDHSEPEQANLPTKSPRSLESLKSSTGSLPSKSPRSLDSLKNSTGLLTNSSDHTTFTGSLNNSTGPRPGKSPRSFDSLKQSTESFRNSVDQIPLTPIPFSSKTPRFFGSQLENHSSEEASTSSHSDSKSTSESVSESGSGSHSSRLPCTPVKIQSIDGLPVAGKSPRKFQIIEISTEDSSDMEGAIPPERRVSTRKKSTVKSAGLKQKTMPKKAAKKQTKEKKETKKQNKEKKSKKETKTKKRKRTESKTEKRPKKRKKLSNEDQEERPKEKYIEPIFDRFQPIQDNGPRYELYNPEQYLNMKAPINHLVLARDSVGNWYPAVLVISNGTQVKVRYEGWGPGNDEWIDCSATHRFRPLDLNTPPPKKSSLATQFRRSVDGRYIWPHAKLIVSMQT